MNAVARTMLLGALLAAPNAHAQQILFYVEANGTVAADWPAIQKCADVPLPGSPKQPGLEQQFQSRWDQIVLCRYLLIGFAAGWQASGKAEPPPYPITGSSREGDMKTPYSEP